MDNYDAFRIRTMASDRYQDGITLDASNTRGRILTHCLTVVLMMESRLQIALTNVYGPTNPTQKLDFMRGIIWIRDQISLP
jgi:hypothetical protein